MVEKKGKNDQKFREIKMKINKTSGYVHKMFDIENIVLLSVHDIPILYTIFYFISNIYFLWFFALAFSVIFERLLQSVQFTSS